MSGSIVGTPIHMAPELFSGQYDNSVDVYAFGILFWYLCAGKVKLPQSFEQCQDKEHLWHSVKKGSCSFNSYFIFEQCMIIPMYLNSQLTFLYHNLGSRPERLSYFDEECWILMESCWAADPSQRPLLGVVEPTLERIRNRFDKIHKMAQDYSLSDHSSEGMFSLS